MRENERAKGTPADAAVTNRKPLTDPFHDVDLAADCGVAGDELKQRSEEATACRRANVDRTE
jgi:hypothetical protein